MTDALGTIRSYYDLRAVLRARVAELGTNYAAVDERCGFTETFTTKLIAPEHIRSLTPMTFDALLGALCIELVARSTKPLEQAKAKLAPREMTPSMLTADKHRPIIVRVSKHRMKKLAKQAAKARKRIPGWKRSAIARKAARARWHPPIVESDAEPGVLPLEATAQPSAPAQP